MNNSSLITFGIPTRHTGSKSIIRTVKSIRISAGKDCPIIIISDNQPVSEEIKNTLRSMNVMFKENKNAGSQFDKLSEIIRMCWTNYFVFTQDDVFFSKSSYGNMLKEIKKNPNATLITPHVVSYPASTFLERVLQVGGDMAYSIGKWWRNGDNYLLANGRCMIFQTQLLRQTRLPKSVVNGDAFLYFANKFNRGSYAHAPSIIVLNNNPKRITEHLNQAKRFLYSAEEMKRIFKRKLDEEYKIPVVLKLKAILYHFLKNPIYVSLYIGINLYTRLQKTDSKVVARTSWDEAGSTKHS